MFQILISDFGQIFVMFFKILYASFYYVWPFDVSAYSLETPTQFLHMKHKWKENHAVFINNGTFIKINNKNDYRAH